MYDTPYTMVINNSYKVSNDFGRESLGVGCRVYDTHPTQWILIIVIKCIIHLVSEIVINVSILISKILAESLGVGCMIHPTQWLLKIVINCINTPCMYVFWAKEAWVYDRVYDTPYTMAINNSYNFSLLKKYFRFLTRAIFHYRDLKR